MFTELDELGVVSWDAVHDGFVGGDHAIGSRRVRHQGDFRSGVAHLSSGIVLLDNQPSHRPITLALRLNIPAQSVLSLSPHRNTSYPASDPLSEYYLNIRRCKQCLITKARLSSF
jgi:hypothetical protein